MTILAAIIGATLRQILSRRRLLMFGGLALFPALILYLNSGDQTRTPAATQIVDGAAGLFSFAVPITALILAAAALGSERRDQTLSFLVIRPISRTTIAGAKLAAAFAAAIALNASGAVALGVVFGIRNDDFGHIVPLVIGSVIATVVYTAIFVPLGYLFERSTLIGLAYVFIWENGIVGTVEVLGVTSPWRIGYSAFGALSPSDVQVRIDDFILTDLSLSIGTSVLQAVIFLAASLALLTWILRRRDLV